MIDNKTLWNTVLSELELSVSKANFSTWFKETFIEKKENGVVYLAVPNDFAKTWLHGKFHLAILKILRNIDENIRAIEYIIMKDDKKKPDIVAQKTQPSPTNELPLADFYINKDDNLNPRYTFETFVIGPFNELAHAAAQAIIKKPGFIYNPFFIYGDTGRGKTHLIQAIGNHIKTANKNKKVFYITSEKYSMDFINSLQNDKVNQFKEKYRKYDVLIMDDIQFLSNKEKTQEELFHLFNHLHEENKQIIFSSDKHPNFIQNLESRIKSRFGAGMIIDIPAPDHESRSALFKIKARNANIDLSNDIIEYLADAVNGNIREIEGALNSLSNYAQLKNKTLTISDVKTIIKGTAKAKRTVSVKDVTKVVADFYNIEEEAIYDKTRRKEVVRPRQIIMYILREDFNMSFPTIGDKLGGRDHTTVIHSCDKVKEDLKTDSVLSHEIEQIRSLL